jgi:hypothetical protein
MAESLTRFTSRIDEFADASGARRNLDHLRRLTGSPEVLRRRTNRNRVIAKETAGKTSPDSGSTDIAGIRSLRGRAALSLRRHGCFFN